MQLKNLFSSLIVFVQMQAVTTILAQSSSRTNVATSDYVGTWVGVIGNSSFEIVLKENKKFKLGNGQTYDVLVGGHSYSTEKNIHKNESLSKFQANQNDFTLFGMLDSEKSEQVSMTFSDRTNYKVVHVSLNFVAGNKNKLRWLVVRETETIIMSPNEKLVKGVSVPTDIMLKRVR